MLPPPNDETIAKLANLGTPVIKVLSPDGTELSLPQEIIEMMGRVMKVVAAGQGVIVAPVNHRLTTQQAADLLGISRPTFVKLLQSGEIAYEQPGRHRRVSLTDVLDYRQRRSTERRKALDRMVGIAEESGMYERTTHQPGRMR